MTVELSLAGATLHLDEAALDQLAGLVAGRIEAGAPAWLSADGAAEHLACPVSRIYALVSAKRIPHHRDGTRLLFRPAELDLWVLEGGGKRP